MIHATWKIKLAAGERKCSWFSFSCVCAMYSMHPNVALGRRRKKKEPTASDIALFGLGWKGDFVPMWSEEDFRIRSEFFIRWQLKNNPNWMYVKKQIMKRSQWQMLTLKRYQKWKDNLEKPWKFSLQNKYCVYQNSPYEKWNCSSAEFI